MISPEDGLIVFSFIIFIMVFTNVFCGTGCNCCSFSCENKKEHEEIEVVVTQPQDI
jgi:hypothetical protein